MKARSRLKASPDAPPSTTSLPDYSFTPTKSSHHRPSKTDIISLPASPLHLDPNQYTRHLGTLFLGLFFGAGTLFLMTHLYPAQVANWIWPRSYIPFQALSFLFFFFISSFLWLSSRRGYLTAVALQILVFLKLQKIEITWVLVLGILALFVIIEVVFSYIQTRNHASFRQNPSIRYRRARS